MFAIQPPVFKLVRLQLSTPTQTFCNILLRLESFNLSDSFNSQLLLQNRIPTFKYEVCYTIASLWRLVMRQSSIQFPQLKPLTYQGGGGASGGHSYPLPKKILFASHAFLSRDYKKITHRIQLVTLYPSEEIHICQNTKKGRVWRVFFISLYLTNYSSPKEVSWYFFLH